MHEGRRQALGPLANPFNQGMGNLTLRSTIVPREVPTTTRSGVARRSRLSGSRACAGAARMGALKSTFVVPLPQVSTDGMSGKRSARA
jgi:hypothetical protein